MHGLLIGYTAVSVVYLAALGHLVRLASHPGSLDPLEALPFLVLNLAAWPLGAIAEKRWGQATLGRYLVLVGDALLPLSVCWLLLFLGARPAVALLGAAAAHLALTALRLLRGHAVEQLYPAFALAWGSLLLCLARGALGLEPAALLWLSLAHGLAFYLLSLRLEMPESAHVAQGATAIVTATLLVIAGFFGRTPAYSMLVALYACSAVLLAWALWSDRLGAASKWGGLAAYAAATASLSVTLAYLQAELVAYVAATAAWILLLAIVGVQMRVPRLEPFRESAHWIAVVLGSWIAVATAALWWSAAGLPTVRWRMIGSPAEWRAAGVASVSAAALSLVAVVLGALAYWRMRYPPIAYSVGGLVANRGLTMYASWLGPILLVLASCAAWVAAGAAPTWAPLAPLLAGLALLNLPRPERTYASAGWAFGGYAALAVAAALAWSAGRGAVPFLLLCAAVALARASWLRTMPPLVAVLAALTLAAIRLYQGDHGPDTTALALLAVGGLAAYRLLIAREGEGLRSGLVFGWSVLAGIVALVLCLTRTPGWLLPPLVLWIGLPLALLGRTRRAGQEDYHPGIFVGEWIETVAFVLAHAAGASALVLAWSSLGLAAVDAGPALAAWAWAHLALHRLLARGAPHRPATMATALASFALATVSLVLPAFSTSRRIAVATLLMNAALFFTWSDPQAAPRRARWLARVGYALVLVALGVAVNAPAPLFAQALLGAALVLWWRAQETDALRVHLVSLSCATAAAVAAVVGAPVDAMPLALTAVGILTVGVLTQAAEGRTARARVTWLWAEAVGLVAVVVECWRAAAGGPAPAVAVLVPLWLGFLLGAALWDAQQPSDPVRPADPEDGWIGLGGYWLAHLAGAGAVVALALETGQGRGGAALWLAWWAAAHGALWFATRSLQDTVARRSLHHAALAMAGIALILAPFSSGQPQDARLAAAMAGALFLPLLAQTSSRWFALGPAIGLVEALWLLGIERKVDVPEYYLSALGALLYVMLRLRRPVAAAPRSLLLGDARDWARAARRSLLPIAIVLLTAAYPFWALLRGGGSVHLFYLAGASALLLFAFAHAGESRAYAYAFCALLLGGALYLFSRGGLEPAVSLFLLAVGTLVLLNLLSARRRTVSGAPAPARVPSGTDHVAA